MGRTGPGGPPAARARRSALARSASSDGCAGGRNGRDDGRSPRRPWPAWEGMGSARHGTVREVGASRARARRGRQKRGVGRGAVLLSPCSAYKCALRAGASIPRECPRRCLSGRLSACFRQVYGPFLRRGFARVRAREGRGRRTRGREASLTMRLATSLVTADRPEAVSATCPSLTSGPRRGSQGARVGRWVARARGLRLGAQAAISH
jgi:hypothetical protein